MKKTLTRFFSNMLVRTILLPSVFTSIPKDQAGLYSLTIKLLQELEKTGVILVDDKSCIKIALSQGVSKWPEKFKKPAQKLLKQLWKNHRFVEVPLIGEIQSICRTEPCQQCIRLAKEYLPLAVFAHQECNPCAKKQLTKVHTVKVIDIDEYSIDADFCSLLDGRGHVLGNGEWRQDKFEQEILIPLFRDAKNIKIYDRWIGRSILTPNADKYKLALEWILNVFLRESRAGKVGIFEVYSGFCTQKKHGKPPPNVTNAVAALCKLETDIQKTHPAFRLIIKKETKAHQMPHNRYLLTNQLAVSIDRGFDLLIDSRTSSYPRRIRDVCIDYCSESEKVEQYVRTLPDLGTTV